MPEITLSLAGLLLALLVFGFVLGWILRGGRIVREKAAINASWQEQIDAQQVEKDRLAEQNKSLMEQIGQYRASKKDADMRAKELSDALQEAFGRRDELQRHLKEIRSELEVTVAQRNKAQASAENVAVRTEMSAGALKEKDQKIFKLSRELESWRNRLPPLTERFRLRDLEAQQAELELKKAREQIAALESRSVSNETRIEPMDASPIADGLDASNDQYEETSEFDLDGLNGADAGSQTGNREAALADAGFEDDLNIDLGEADFDRVADANETAGNDDQSELATAGYGRDDLQRIKGVGPAIEKTLNGLGFFRFRQIAEMSEYDIDRVASQLRGFRSRIYREDWIGQARMLQIENRDDAPA